LERTSKTLDIIQNTMKTRKLIEVKILKHIQDREQRAVPLFKRNQPASLK